MIQICALASGSNGNCYYVGNDKEAVLIDAGISRRMLLKRLKEVKLAIGSIKGVFITHEHTDHMRGFKAICEMSFIPGYITKGTLNNARKDFYPNMVNLFEIGDNISIDSITIHSFKKSHDAADPCGFIVAIGDKRIAVLTDLGDYDETIQKELASCDAAFLETNYDDDMLLHGKYPPFLKRRVASDKGHLSNAQALALVENATGSKLNTILLSHISKDNNTLDLALESLRPLKDKCRLILTSRYGPTEVFSL